MSAYQKEKIRQNVRERYAEIAKDSDGPNKTEPQQGCCSPISLTTGNPVEGGSGCGCAGADQMSALVGYSEKDLADAPEGANLGLGCGNPVALASLKPGETVVDLGSGGGFDCFLAAPRVGERGRIIGVDMTPEMVAKARGNAKKANVKNVEFRLGEIEHLPVADNTADIIISNCVINLSPDKKKVYKDAFRVLKPGGRLMISDIVTTEPLPDEIKQNLSLVSACIGGAATIDETAAMLENAGFVEIRIRPVKGSRNFIGQWIPGTTDTSCINSANIQAVKP